MATVEIESGMLLSFPDHGVGVSLSEQEAAEVAATICEAVITRRGVYGRAEYTSPTGDVEIRGSAGDGITLTIRRAYGGGII